MLLALAQVTVTQNKADNLAALQRFASRAASYDAKLVLFPEATMYAFGAAGASLAEHAEDLEGDFVTQVSAIAESLHITIVTGMFERSPDPKLVYNTVVAVGPGGQLLASYRKIHLYDAFGVRESDRFLPGPIEPLVFDLDRFRVGVLTCYDLRFPELARSLVDNGAEILLVPAAWVHGRMKEEHWSVLLRARAIENTVFVAAADQCGGIYSGRSLIVDPMGAVLAGLGEQEDMVVGVVDRERLEQVRGELPVLTHRRLMSAVSIA